MHLEKIELSGFKSFAKATTLEFPSKVTAIVGPNGSGKSNIAEGIRWVLGEQSMKSLRGKRGEDLIWNGSPQLPRMGKASVTLIFNNADKKIPLDFDEVTIARKIFRDGMNEYYINDSQVRLKDVIELMARIGLGESKHNIIGQGEVDKIILATPKERREMLEEALGLRIYQLKKNETERKLDATEQNMSQVEGLIKEISPHLRFLKVQAQKAETRGSVEAELKEFQKAYLGKEAKEIEVGSKKLGDQSEPFHKKQIEIKKDTEKLLKEIADTEKLMAEDSLLSEEEKKLTELEARRRELEREIGRLEGKVEVERERWSQPKVRVVDTGYIQSEVKEIIAEIRSILSEENQADVIKTHLHALVEDLEGLLAEIQKGTTEEKREAGESAIVRELEKTVVGLQDELAKVAKEIGKLESARVEIREKSKVQQQKVRELDSELRAKQDEERDLALEMQRFKFEEEKIQARSDLLRKDLKEAGFEEKDLKIFADLSDVEIFKDLSGEELKRKIDRLRAKLEEIGGIDESVVKEYRETEARHAFLTKELADLKQAHVSLKELIKELDKHIKEDFKKGFAKIKDEFHNYFRIIFGGGRAALQLVDVPVRGAAVEEDEESAVVEFSEESKRPTIEGIDISIDLPRKRIKGLAMLSGGERALTAIALLFSITAVNPPPFLVLDETDAALDEANSQRYSAILKELSKKTQLLLVTHNRETMKSASILYGVTMGDDGVSKLLSLRLEEAEVYTNR